MKNMFKILIKETIINILNLTKFSLLYFQRRFITKCIS